MATPPTSDENARTILRIFAHFNGRPQHVLGGNNLMAYAANNSIEMADVRLGLTQAIENGWVEETNSGGIRLTETGYAEM